LPNAYGQAQWFGRVSGTKALATDAPATTTKSNSAIACWAVWELRALDSMRACTGSGHPLCCLIDALQCQPGVL
jgi:hypothetical protein